MMEKNKLQAITPPVAERAQHPRPPHAPHQSEMPQQHTTPLMEPEGAHRHGSSQHMR